MEKIIKTTFLGLGMLFFLSSLIYAQEPLIHEDHRGLGSAPWKKFAKKLNLSEEQEKRKINVSEDGKEGFFVSLIFIHFISLFRSPVRGT